MKVNEYLEREGVRFKMVAHAPTYSALELAEETQTPGDEVAKTVVLKADAKPLLAVLQSTHKIDFEAVKRALSAQEVELVDEGEFKKLFPDCELGALPPFGSQYEMETLLDEPLTQDESILFEGNTHQEAVRMAYADFARLEKPRVAAFTKHL